ncbi:MAG TPA: CHAD domain-containing protein [Alphaproteobacteria bacterium]|nr:CHAD domain-containing protein [Alphaproteobacteria bacterium]
MSASPPLKSAIPRPSKAKPLRLAPHITGASAFRRIALACLDHLVANEQAAIAGENPEGVHQARVAIRRLRSALALFRDYAGVASARDFRDRLRDAGRALGEGRDWDVFLTETLPAYLAERQGARADSIVKIATRLRIAGHRRVRRTLTTPDHQRLLYELRGWIIGDSWRNGLGAEAYRALESPCRHIARGILDRAAKKVRKLGEAMDSLTPEDRHELRKAMKRLRYGSEFLGSLYPPGEVAHYLSVAEGLQDILGKLNDAAGIIAIADRPPMRKGCPYEELQALREWAAADTERNLAALKADWAVFEKVEPFWR